MLGFLAHVIARHKDQDFQPVLQLQALFKQKKIACQIWKALAVTENIPDFTVTADHYVLDGKNAGSGKAFGWQALAQSTQDLSTCFLAGGLNSDNIIPAITHMVEQDLFGLDINSGVESSPGVKCSAKINEVFAKIRNY